MRILVTGKNGQLGSELNEIKNNYPEIEFLFTGSKELNITDRFNIENTIKKFNPDLVINCAAYTAVDKAEDEPELADTVNHIAVRNLAEICKSENIRLIHISTDYVFDGKSDIPYKETDETNPINEYGKSKLNGEHAIIKSGVQAIIIRTSWVYSSFGNNFVKTMIRLGKEKDEINVVADQFGSPTYARDLAEVCISISLQKEKWQPRTTIFHYSNEGVISWYEFANEIMKLWNLKCKVNPITTDQYPAKVKRPIYSTLNKEKIIKTFKLIPSNWKNSLKNKLINSI